MIFTQNTRERSNFTQNYSIERKQNASTKTQSINHSVETSEATRFRKDDFLQGIRKHTFDFKNCTASIKIHPTV